MQNIKKFCNVIRNVQLDTGLLLNIDILVIILSQMSTINVIVYSYTYQVCMYKQFMK